MGELQATVEFSVELFKFYNVDLFQRGFYQIRTTLKVLPKIPVKIEISLPQNPKKDNEKKPTAKNRLKQRLISKGKKVKKTDLVFPACVVNGTAVSKTFQILYRNEEVVLNDVILFKVHVIVDSHKIEETIERADFQLLVELWFTDQSFGPDQHSSIQCVSTRTLNLHFLCSKGLHHHLPILFDYFHLSAVTITVHASLVAVHQPYINTSRPNKPGWLLNSPRITCKLQSSSVETALFGGLSSKSSTSGIRLSQARQVHREICSILLSAYENLQEKLQEYMKMLPPWQQLRIESIDCYARLHNLSDFAKSADSEDDLIAIANSDIAQLCAENIILWQQFLEVFTLKDRIRQHLAREHHTQRVKRFAEGFFVVEHPRHALLSCSDNSYQNYQAIAEMTRKSRYYTMLPPLAIECVEMDGSVDMLPLIFEDHYQEGSHRPSKVTSSSDPGINIQDIDLNMKDRFEHKQEFAKISQSASRLAPSTSELSPTLSARQRRSPSVDTGTNKYKSLRSEMKESRSLNTEMNCLSSPVHSPSMHLSKEVKSVSHEPSPESRISERVLLKDTVRPNLKLDLHSVGEFYNIPTGTLLSKSIKGKLKNKLNKVQLFKTNNNSIMPQISSLNSSSESVVLTSFKKLEQSISLPQNLTSHLSLPRATIPSSSYSKLLSIRHACSTLSMPNFPCSNENEKPINMNSESMPDLGGTSSPPLSYQTPDALSWPSTSLMLLSPDTTDATDTEQPDHSMENIPPAPKEFASVSLDDETVSFSSGLTSTLPTPAEATSGQQHGCDSGSPTTCNSEFPSEPSVEWKSSQSNSSRTSHKEDADSLKGTRSKSIDSSSTVNSFQKISSSSKPKENEKHIYEEIHLPPEQFRDPPTHSSASSSTTQTCGEDISSQDFSYSITDSDYFKSRSSSAKQNQKQLKSIQKKTSKKYLSGRKSASLPNSPTDVTSSFTVAEKGRAAHLHCQCHANIYIPDMIRSIDREGVRSSYLDAQCTLFEMLTDCAEQGSDNDLNPEHYENDHTSLKVPPPPLPKPDGKNRIHQSPSEFFDWENTANFNSEQKNIGDQSMNFLKAKEGFKRQLNIPALLYSEFPTLASSIPYFHVSEDFRMAYSDGIHLIVCVHGLDGNSADLRLVKTYLELGLPGSNLDFLMSERNQGDTFSDFETMTDKLIAEILSHIEMYCIKPSKISFIGHSLGNIIIRSALARPEMKPWTDRLHTFLSLSGPHLGTLYNNSGLVNMGMWFMQKWKKSGSLLQLAMKDASNIRQTFLYKLSQKTGLEYFKNVLLFGSSQDRYVPIHSARVELCKAALKDNSVQGAAYREMVHNLLQPALNKFDINFIRYDVHHALPNTPNSLIGRAAHIAVLDSELFIEKFLTVCGLKYFR